MIKDRMPVHREADSSIPPTRAPKRFDPRACPLNLNSAKLRMNTMEANATGEHKANEETNTFTQNESKKSAWRGRKYETSMQIPIPTYATRTGIVGQDSTRKLTATISTRIAAMTMELTSHVVPNSMAIRLTICASRSRNPAPRKKKCQ